MRLPTLNELPPPPLGKTGWPWTENIHSPYGDTKGSPLPKVTIVTPSFNQGWSIEGTIRSVLFQGYPNLEYIIMDGGSTDETIEIIKKYERWVSYWVSEPDCGQADAIAKGFGRATGDIIAWINSDDWYLSGAFFSASNAFLVDKDLGMIYGDCKIYDRDGAFAQLMTVPEFDSDLLKFTDYIRQPASFFRRSAYEKIGGLDIRLNWCMDWDLWLRFSKLIQIRKVDYTFAAARIYKENKSLSGDQRRYAELLHLFFKNGIYNSAVLFFILEYLARSLRFHTRKFTLLSYWLFEKPHNVWVLISRFLKRLFAR
jgi:glycosyltransferase involved in cell wall biosynthesis